MSQLICIPRDVRFFMRFTLVVFSHFKYVFCDAVRNFILLFLSVCRDTLNARLRVVA